MSLPYKAIQWTERKLLYDLALGAGMLLFLGAFLLVSIAQPGREDAAEWLTVLTRGFGILAIVLLHGTLSIGPLCRLNPRFLPLLANRRHLGVATFLTALVHGVLATVVYHWGGAFNPLASVLLGSGQVFSPHEFPFEVFGLGALLLLAVLAATSHDFWIAHLSPRTWKRLHMAVYVAWVLVILHVGFGVLQNVRNPVYPLLVVVGTSAVLWLHLRAARRESEKDAAVPEADANGWLRVCRPEEIPEERAVVVSTGQERVAIFRHWQGISAISNVCAHQGGPLGEGKVIAGCVRCPWHGALYFPETGKSPPPFEKAVATYSLKLADGAVWLNPRPHPPGTKVEPLLGRAKPARVTKITTSSGVMDPVVSPRPRPDEGEV